MPMTQKQCGKCSEAKPMSDFYRTKSGGPSSYCKPCQRAYAAAYSEQNRAKKPAVRINLVDKEGAQKAWKAAQARHRRKDNPEYAREYYLKNRDRFVEQAKEWNRNNPDYRKNYYLENKDYYRQKVLEFRERNPDAAAKYYREMSSEKKEKRLEAGRQWWKQNTEQRRALRHKHSAKRRAVLMDRRPLWVNDDDMAAVYISCPEGQHVDHIVPLQGKLVSGLDVPWNLQHLTPRANMAKGNSFQCACSVCSVSST